MFVSLIAMAIYYAVVIFLEKKGKRKKESDFEDVTITGYNFDEEMQQYAVDDYFDDSNTDDVPVTDDFYQYNEKDVQGHIASKIAQYDELLSSFNQSRIQFSVDSLKLTRDLFQ